MTRLLTIALCIVLINCKGPNAVKKGSTVQVPAAFKGNFKDDYDIRYSISDSVWVQQPNIKYYLLSYDSAGQYFIAKNASTNPSEANLYSRIDIMKFSGMAPFEWGFCLTAYAAKDYATAAATASADRANPRKGCGGYPFSRMKRD